MRLEALAQLLLLGAPRDDVPHDGGDIRHGSVVGGHECDAELDRDHPVVFENPIRAMIGDLVFLSP
jgi:hypothetical protein